MTTAPLAQRVVALLRERGETVATAESLTGGLVCAALVDVPGASEVVKGGVVAYAAEVKTSVLGVDAALIEREGTVHPQVARQLADGVRRRFATTWGLGTTGVAGPGAAEGHPAGTVFVAVAGPEGVSSTALTLTGDRSQVRNSTVAAVLAELGARLGTTGSDPSLTTVTPDATEKGGTP